MKYQYLLLGVLYGLLLSSCSLSAEEGDKEMDRYIANLMGKMTLHEKLGQLNLPSGGDLVTGNVNSAELTKMVRNQEIGGFFNVKGIRKIVDLQRIAIDSTRLGIPLLVGADVIHGYETIFPIPLALSCSWDTLAVERMARISAVEASADGICWTFSRWLTFVVTVVGGVLQKVVVKTLIWVPVSKSLMYAVIREIICREKTKFFPV